MHTGIDVLLQMSLIEEERKPAGIQVDYMKFILGVCAYGIKNLDIWLDMLTYSAPVIPVLGSYSGTASPIL